jgi:hypothetical protein
VRMRKRPAHRLAEAQAAGVAWVFTRLAAASAGPPVGLKTSVSELRRSRRSSRSRDFQSLAGRFVGDRSCLAWPHLAPYDWGSPHGEPVGARASQVKPQRGSHEIYDKDHELHSHPLDALRYLLVNLPQAMAEWDMPDFSGHLIPRIW